jgi:hypothetical protein
MIIDFRRPGSLVPAGFRPIALRPCLSTGLLLSMSVDLVVCQTSGYASISLAFHLIIAPLCSTAPFSLSTEDYACWPGSGPTRPAYCAHGKSTARAGCQRSLRREMPRGAPLGMSNRAVEVARPVSRLGTACLASALQRASDVLARRRWRVLDRLRIPKAITADNASIKNASAGALKIV